MAGINPQVYDVVDVAVRMFTNDVGGMMSGSPKMMAQSCDVIITVLPSADALRDVLYGWEGLAGGFAPGGAVIDMERPIRPQQPIWRSDWQTSAALI